jgi:predicted transporter
MQAQNNTAQADPGFKLPADKTTPDDPQPKTTPETATGPVEVVPGALAPSTDTSTRDIAVGGAIFLVLLVVYFFVRNAYVHHMVVRRVAPSTAGSAGWMLFVGLAFLSAAVVLAIVNASKYLTFGVTAPLVVVGVVALVAALVIGRR